MARKYVALYITGRNIPCGALRSDIADEVIKDLKAGLGGSYETKPITKTEARQIRKDIEDGHDGLENLIRRYGK